MDFFQHQDQARRKSRWLVTYFILAVISIIATVYLVVVGILAFDEDPQKSGLTYLWHPDLLLAVSGGTLAVIGIGSLYKIAALSGGGEAVAQSLGGRRVPANTTDLAERVLLNVVDEMAIASGTPVPPVYLLDHEPGINAFAAGTTPQNAVIGVTQGAIHSLNRDELQGVIAHEFSHILNGDMRLNLRLMGLLHGILLISLIGWFLMRFRGRSGDGKKANNALPLIGLCLYLIGYVGLFFGNLIKSAVSRQREFLADASAVQFTRLPQGIAGALKKLGGLASGSRLVSPQAEEASHLFFGNGVATKFLQMLSTHPPLKERILRIDSTFDGTFPPVAPVAFRPSDLIDPGSLAARRASFAGEALHEQAVVGSREMGAHPLEAVAQIGAPTTQHIDYAARLIQALPPELQAEVRDPLGAIATIYALLIDTDESDVRRRQLAYLEAHVDPRARHETLRMAPYVAKLHAETRLPLVSLVVPALQGLSEGQFSSFKTDVQQLIQADRQVTLFEYAVHRLVLKRLVPRLRTRDSARRSHHAGAPEDRGETRYTQWEPLLPACRALLSTLAHLGHTGDDAAEHAFQQGASRLASAPHPVLVLAPRSESGLKPLDAALDQLSSASPAIKKRVLEACSECIAADTRVRVEEGELLRVIADALDCPMPPLIGGNPPLPVSP